MHRPATALLLLALSTPTCAAIFNVGPDGDYPTLQAALDIAVANGVDDNIRIQSGTHVVAGTSFEHSEDFYIELQGGLGPDFTLGTEDPSLTVLSGGGSGRPLEFVLGAGQMQISNLTIAEGLDSTAGGGMLATVVGGAELLLRDLVIRDNRVESASLAVGGGLRLVLADESSADIFRSEFHDNVADGATAFGGGLAIEIIDGLVTSGRVLVAGNEAIGSNQAQGGGVHLHLGDSDNGFELVRGQILGNRVAAPTASLGAGLFVANGGGSSQFALQAVELAGNLDQGQSGGDGQLQIASSGGTFRLRSVVAQDAAGTGGIQAMTSNFCQVLATNLTVAGNGGDGFAHDSSSGQTHTLHNSLLFANDGDNFRANLTGEGNYVQNFNTLDIDPGVVDAANGDYRLAAHSAAIDAGFGNVPGGGVGTIDADGNARVTGPFVDQGAYEFVPTQVFADGFED